MVVLVKPFLFYCLLYMHVWDEDQPHTIPVPSPLLTTLLAIMPKQSLIEYWSYKEPNLRSFEWIDRKEMYI